MTDVKEKQEPIQQSVLVDCPIEDAFRLFTEGFAEWCPLVEDGSIEPWEGGRVFDSERQLGLVTVWDPPRQLALSWNRGMVDIEFIVEADGTRVTLTHSGWERSNIQACAKQFGEFAGQQMLVPA